MTSNHNEEVISEKVIEYTIEDHNKGSGSGTLEREATRSTTNTTAIVVQDKVRPAQDGEDVHDRELSAGVAKVEAAQAVWGKKGYIFLLVGLGLAAYIYSLDGITTYLYLAFATSSVFKHSLTGTVYTAGSIILAVGKPFMAKLADYFGRGETYIVTAIFYVVGYILYAGAQNIGTIAGAQILYSLGYTGLQMLQTITINDVTTLRYRAFWSGIFSMPYIINTFISAEVYNGVMSGGGWRWGYGMFAILVPTCLVPIVGSLLWGQWKAKKEGKLMLVPSPEKNFIKRPISASYLASKEMDLPGLFLVAAALALILLPLGLAPLASQGWRTPSMIAMIVIGVLLLPVFAVWEIKLATKYGYLPIAPLRFFKNGNIFGAIFISFFDFVSFYLQYTYQSSFIYVTKDWSNREFNYFANIQTISLCLFGLIAGIILIKWSRPKWLMVFGLLARLLGVGLMIHSRGALANTAELVWSQLLQGAGGGFASTISGVMAVAMVPHSDMAVVSALVLLFAEIGNSLGSAIATAVWTNQMPGYLAEHVPTNNQTLLNELYGSITVIATYSADDPIRQGVIEAYAIVMRNLCIGATVTAVVPPLLAYFCITDIELDDKQNKFDNRDLSGRKEDEKENEKESEKKTADIA